MAIKKQTTEIKKEPKKWIFGELLDSKNEIEYIFTGLYTEKQFMEEEFDTNCIYFRIDPIHIEKIKIETKIVKA